MPKNYFSRWSVRAIATALLLQSCASPGTLTKNINVLVASGKYPEAIALVEKSKVTHYKKKNALLYYLDLGMLQHLSGQYAESNRSFEKAKNVSQELFTKSITTELSTFLISDNMRPYYGEDFERALIHVFCALNYIYLGQETEALVEARQVDFLLQKLKTDYGHKNIYKEDAFVRYLMGMLYENQREINNAFISHWKALETYKDYKKYFGTSPPVHLIKDALRLANALGFKDDIKQIQKQWGEKRGIDIPGQLPKGSGELVILHYNGLAPIKIDHYFEISFGKGWAYVNSTKLTGEAKRQREQASALARSIAANTIVRVAFPKYVKTPYRIKSLDAQATDISQESHTGTVAEDIGTLAIKNLEDRINRIRVKAITRAVIKFALAQKASKEVEKEKGKAMGLLTKAVLQTAATATEHADKRCWQSLPDQIQLVRMTLPEGQHNIKLDFHDVNGKLIETRNLENIKITEGKKTFMSVRTAK